MEGSGPSSPSPQERIADLERANRDLEQFAYLAAHDLQAPLAVVSGFADLLKDRYADRLDEGGRDFLRYMSEGIADMQHLIDGMLAMARSGSGGLARTSVDSRALLDGVLAGLREEMERARVEVRVQELPVLEADPERLRQVFANLVSNAVKFTDGGGCVEVAARREDGAWRFEVRDEGIGVPPEEAERVFEPLHRLDTGRGGAGIGLTVCRRIVESHGGSIGVTPAAGGGSVFAFTLPDRAAAT